MSIDIKQNKVGFSYRVRYQDNQGSARVLSFQGNPIGLAGANALEAALKSVKAQGGSIEQYLSSNGYIEAKSDPIKKTLKSINISQLCDSYIMDRKINNKSKEWIKNLSGIFDGRLKPAFKDVTLKSITYVQLMRYVSEHWEGCTVATINRNIMVMKTMFTWGIGQGYLTVNPLALWKKNKEPKYPMQLTVTDFKYLLTFCPPHLKWALYVAYETGIRPGVKELFKVKYSDVNYDRNEITVKGKLDYIRVVEITESFKRMVQAAEVVAKTPYLVEYNGKQVDSLNSSWITARKKANLPYRVRLYDIRHLFATSMINEGADLAAVSALLGHHSIEMTTEAYYHCMPGEKKKAIGLRPSIDLYEEEAFPILDAEIIVNRIELKNS